MESLPKALNFVNLCQKDLGPIYSRHCIISNGYCVATDGVLAAGIQSDTVISCNPHTKTMLAAVNNIELKDHHFVLVDNNTLLLRSGKKRVSIPCVGFEQTLPVVADNAQFLLPDGFIDKIITVGSILKETSETLVASALLLTASCAIATDGFICIAYEHGMSIPDILVPKSFLTALAKVAKKPLYFGYSDNSFTVWFEDGSWLKTNLYDIKLYPTVKNILKSVMEFSNYLDAPVDFLDKLRFLAKFSENNLLTLKESVLSTTDGNKSASYDFDELPGSGRFRLSNLMVLAELGNKINLVGDERAVYFAGDNIKGMISKIRS